jgi:O-antigen/teichoic acid export membrane protein
LKEPDTPDRGEGVSLGADRVTAEASSRATELTRGSLLARNTALSMAGELVPMAAALIAVPLLVRGLGTDRFGLLSLAWVVIGYFSLFDLGLGKALTKLVASRIGEGCEADVPSQIRTGLFLMGVLGLAGGATLAVASPWLIGRWLKVPDAIRGEALASFRILALAVPLMIVTSGLRGILEAEQRLGLILAIRIPVGLLSYAGPLAVLPFSGSLVPVVVALAGIRGVSLVLYLAGCLRAFPALRGSLSMSWTAAPALLRFGGWMSVTNVVSPLLVMLDRFVIGALVSVTAVAYYATPLDIVNYAGVIPGAITNVLFPAFATSFARDRERTATLYSAGLKLNLVVMFPLTLALAAFSSEGLDLWLGPEFAREGAPVVRWVAFGLLASALARVSFWLVQGVGRPDLPAKFHLAEIVLYVPLLWWATRTFGIVGAAAAWTVRVFLDTGLLLLASQRLVPLVRAARGPLAATAAAAGAGLVLIQRVAPLGLRAAIFVVGASGFFWLCWRHLLSWDEREWALRLARRFRAVDGTRP